MENLLIVIVIYESKIQDSKTIQSLIQLNSTCKLPDILLYDNSKTSVYTISDGESIIKYYHHDKNNSGVSGAYNYAYKLGLEKNKQWLTLFDQDTIVGENFFIQLSLAINGNEEALYAPTVKTNNIIVSPSYYFFHKPITYKKRKVGKLNSSGYSVINSGLTISIEYLQKSKGFDVDLPLDYSDHYFFYRYKKLQPSFYVLDCCINHGLSSFQHMTYEESLIRFRKHTSFTRVFSLKVKSILPLFWLILRALKLTAEYRKFEFVKYLFHKN